jgi:hypothetical protein
MESFGSKKAALPLSFAERNPRQQRQQLQQQQRQHQHQQ